MKIRQSLAATLMIGFCFAQMPPVLAETGSITPPPARTSAPTAPVRTPAPAVTVASGRQIFTAELLQSLGSLTVARGASAIIDFGKSPLVNILGNISNSGSIYAISTNPSVTRASLFSLNIFNNQGALLSTLVPATALSGITSAVPKLNLSLNAVNNILNAGTISSAGSLNIQSGNLISNQGVMSAAGDVNVLLGTGNLVNAGMIASLAGNINISSVASQNILINNTGGTMQALLGSISVATQASAGLEKVNLDIIGGDLLSGALNLANPGGAVDINVGKLTGPLNISACSTHVTAATPDLVLHNIDLTGDPTFYNSAGNVVIDQDLDLRPVTYVNPQVSVAIVASGDITKTSALKTIDVSTKTSSDWTGDQNCGSIMLVAGAQFTPTTTAQVNDDTTNALTITGASSTGGKIDLPGVSVGAQGGYTNLSAISGNVTLAAYKGTSSDSGDITIGNIATGEGQPSIPDDTSGLNGTVTIVGERNITTGEINTAGNKIVTYAWNGSITIASAAIKMMQPTLSQSADNLNPNCALTNTNPPLSTNTMVATPGATSFVVTDPTNIAAGTILYLNPLGANAEKVTVASVSGTTITLSAPLTRYHTLSERIYTDASQVVINPGAGNLYPMVPITQNGAIFAPDFNSLKSGDIKIGGRITSGANVNIATNGSVQVDASIALTQNPTAVSSISPPDYLAYPSIDIRGDNGVTVSSGVIVSSEIAKCATCPNTVNIVTQNLTNNGSITGGAANLTKFSNAMVSVTSPGNLAVSGTGSITVPKQGVIELAAADKGTLTLGSSHTFNTGEQGLVLFNAQGSGGTVQLAAGSVETITGNPAVCINTPNLTLNSGSQINATGNSSIAIGSGYTSDPLNVLVSGSATINTGTDGVIKMRPSDVQNLTLDASGGPATLTLTGHDVWLTYCEPGTITIGGSLTLAGTTATQQKNPSGGITGVGFQPYVGGLSTNGGQNYVGFAAYPYQAVLAMLAPLAAEQQFQAVSTYTQQYSSVYVIQAAKQVGMRVSAGVFLRINDDGSVDPQALATAQSDIQRALTGASTYGNVMDIVVGNEDIVGGANPDPSINTLNSQILAVQGLRNSTINPLTGTPFTSTTLPVTTRQIAYVLNLVKTSDTPPVPRPSMVSLVQNCEQHIYGNFYPFYDEYTVIPALIANPGMNFITFRTLIDTYMSNTYDTIASNFTTYVVTGIPVVHVSETGWATPMQNLPANGPNYSGSSLPQSTLSVNWPDWYYKCMQWWSQNHPNPLTSTNGVPINGYFASFNEPWKGIDGANPNNTAVYTAALAASGTTQLSTTNGAAFQTLTPMSVLINPGGATMEVQNINSISSNTLNISALVFNHNSGEPLHAGTPEEPFFGIWRALGSCWADGSVYTLDSYSQKYRLPVYTGSAYVEPLAGSNLFNNSPLNMNPADVQISMSNGRRLFAPDHDLTVRTSLGDLQIKAGSAVVLVQDKSALAVMNLHDRRRGAVAVLCGGRSYAIPVGRQVVLTANPGAGFDEINPSGVAYRRLAKTRFGDTGAFTAEFSIPSALAEFEELALLRSSIKKEERQLAGKILKTAAAMNFISGQQTPFKTSKKSNGYLASL
jgi:hypothetical protein